MRIATKLKIASFLGLNNPVARVLTSPDEGPVRRIVSGRAKHYTGFFLSAKAGFRQMPWESRKGEKTAMMLAEASSRVVTLLAQPHRLEILVKEQKAPLKYFPDLQLRVHGSFLEDLRRGIPFSMAALAHSHDEPDEKHKTVILEIKDDRDRRQHDKRYIRKLELAGEIYRMMGIDFFVIVRGEEILPYHLRIASSVISRRNTLVGQLDVWTVQRVLSSGPQPASKVANSLGAGASGWAKMRALHVRRIIEIDLSDYVSAETSVTLLHNNSMHIRVRS